MEQRWNDIDRGKPKDSERNLFQCHFADHISLDPGLRGEKSTTNRLSYGTVLFKGYQGNRVGA
jgi:hypothetical protein